MLEIGAYVEKAGQWTNLARLYNDEDANITEIAPVNIWDAYNTDVDVDWDERMEGPWQMFFNDKTLLELVTLFSVFTFTYSQRQDGARSCKMKSADDA